MKRIFLLCITHLSFAVAGFALGIYLLPILTAPDAPTANAVENHASQALFQGEFIRELSGSDFLHWGEGKIFIGKDFIALDGRIAPGPDYRLYLSPVFVENEIQFGKEKDQMVVAGNIDTFENFIITLPRHVDPSLFNTAIVWCESFGEFITAGKYR